MSKHNYCLPLQVTSLEAARQQIILHESAYQYFEVWLDYLTEWSSSDIAKLCLDYPDRIIIVFRRNKLEPILLPLESRFNLLDEFEDLPVLVDLDITSQRQELDQLVQRSSKLRVICSFHDYNSTPSEKQIYQILSNMEQYNPYIYKIATHCTENADSLRLLRVLLDQKSLNRRVVVLGMGPHGLATRIFGSLWGNELTFAPQTLAESSAPGQLTYDTVSLIMNRLEEAYGRK